SARGIPRTGACRRSGAKRGGEETAVLRADKRAASNRLTGRDPIPNDGAEQLLGITIRRALDVIGVLHQLLWPGLIGEGLGVDDRADRKRLAGDQNLWANGHRGCG